MKTSVVFEAISIARVNAPRWEVYTFDNQVLGDEINLEVLDKEDKGLKEYYDLQVAQLMDDENIVQALLANNILYYPNGVMIEHGEL